MPRLYGFDNQALTRVRAQERQVVREAVGRIRAGQSQAEVAAWMTAEGHRGTMGGEWTSMTLGRLLDNPAIAGLERIPDTGELVETGREGLITPEEFEWLQERPGRRGSVRAAEPREGDYQYLLSEGLTVCADCGQRMAGSRTGAGTPSYRCQSNFEGRGGCGKVRINAPRLEDYVAEYVLGELSRPGAQAELESACKAMAAEAQQAVVRIASLEGKRTELADPYAQGQLSRDSFVAADRRIGQELKAERARLRYLEQAVDVPLGGVEDLAHWWEHAPFASKRGLAVLLLEKIEVHPARARGVRSVDDRVTLTWRAALAS
ncbi:MULTISPECIES: recombinase zinc beta ribbon domain-containing protein [unclassified Streptomyces]|uniref:recombinase zinc beta ribbon domain-containing protein n=1 Tax=unclassified Streptomyces TaxID=2593676 RepID=UPI0029B47871|nr:MULTISPECIES: recombinase zinc beta ribbon domain-containing protein [unclassified Streptomyces]MDX3766345.1 recombinase zinc beta ribbon domain-containing protein [Streptomyces sp. AK08-01B]MDX3816399.1 recombinase zinc beta ribbon domain-containing protein [Streptomyces sp. AK08-01A]